jgi:hypothetical protein
VGAFFGFIFSLWLLGAFLSSFYFWLKKTDRSQAPITRRTIALGYGLAWPVMVIKYFTSRDQARDAQVQQQAAASRILGNGGGAPVPPQPAPGGQPSAAPGGQSRIQNPFDN